MNTGSVRMTAAQLLSLIGKISRRAPLQYQTVNRNGGVAPRWILKEDRDSFSGDLAAPGGNKEGIFQVDPKVFSRNLWEGLVATGHTMESRVARTPTIAQADAELVPPAIHRLDYKQSVLSLGNVSLGNPISLPITRVGAYVNIPVNTTAANEQAIISWMLRRVLAKGTEESFPVASPTLSMGPDALPADIALTLTRLKVSVADGPVEIEAHVTYPLQVLNAVQDVTELFSLQVTRVKMCLMVGANFDRDSMQMNPLWWGATLHCYTEGADPSLTSLGCHIFR